MRLTLNYSLYTVISVCNHPCDTKTITHSPTRIRLLQPRIHDIWMKFLWNQNIFHLGIKYFLIIDFSYILSQTKTFPSMSYNSFLFFKQILKCKVFWLLSSYLSFVAWKKPVPSTAIFSFTGWKQVFLISLKYITITWLFKMRKFTWINFNFNSLCV